MTFISTLADLAQRGHEFRHAPLAIARRNLSISEPFDFSAHDEPFIICDANLHADRTQRIDHRWLVERYGDVQVNAFIGNRLNRKFEQMPLSVACERMLAGPQEVYARNVQVPGPFVGLEDNIALPACVPADRACIARVWIGPRNSMQPFHKDTHNPLAKVSGLLFQLVGTKEVLYVGERHESYMKQKLGAQMDYHYSNVDLFDDATISREFLDNVQISAGVIGADEGVFLPKNTWHHVRGMTPSVSMSFWWHDEFLADLIFRISNVEAGFPHRFFGDPQDRAATADEIESFGGVPSLMRAAETLSASSRDVLAQFLPDAVAHRLREGAPA